MSTREFEISRSVLVGDTANNELIRAQTVLRNEGINPEVVMEFSVSSEGVFCGVAETKELLERILPEAGREVWALDEGAECSRKEVVLRVRASYGSFGIYETAIRGMLSSCSGWATGARKCFYAADGIPVVSYGANYVHPSVVGVMDYSAVIGNCVAGSSLVGSRLNQLTPSGTMPHALVLLIGDTLRSILAFDRHMPPEVPRVVLVDTFKDEAEESLIVADALRDKLRGIRLDTPEERGGVTPHLVNEIRSRLDESGHNNIDIYVSGGLNPERIGNFVAAHAAVNAFAVGHYIAASPPLAVNADIKEIEGRAVAKRGRIPGIIHNARLARIL